MQAGFGNPQSAVTRLNSYPVSPNLGRVTSMVIESTGITNARDRSVPSR